MNKNPMLAQGVGTNLTSTAVLSSLAIPASVNASNYSVSHFQLKTGVTGVTVCDESG